MKVTHRQATIRISFFYSWCACLFSSLHLYFSFHFDSKTLTTNKNAYFYYTYALYLAVEVFFFSVFGLFRLVDYPKTKARHRKLPFLPLRVFACISWYVWAKTNQLNWIHTILPHFIPFLLFFFQHSFVPSTFCVLNREFHFDLSLVHVFFSSFLLSLLFQFNVSFNNYCLLPFHALLYTAVCTMCTWTMHWMAQNEPENNKETATTTAKNKSQSQSFPASKHTDTIKSKELVVFISNKRKRRRRTNLSNNFHLLCFIVSMKWFS